MARMKTTPKKSKTPRKGQTNVKKELLVLKILGRKWDKSSDAYMWLTQYNDNTPPSWEPIDCFIDRTKKGKKISNQLWKDFQAKYRMVCHIFFY